MKIQAPGPLGNDWLGDRWVSSLGAPICSMALWGALLCLSLLASPSAFAQKPDSPAKQPDAASPQKSVPDIAATAKPATPSKQAVQEDWPLFRGDAASTGVARTQLPDKLDVQWQFKVKDGGFEGTPIVVKNKTDGKLTVYAGDMNGVLYALDLKSGEMKWKYDTGLGFTASPAYRDGRIFIGDLDGVFWCLDELGKVQWRFQCEAEVSGSANFFEGGVLFGSQDTKLYLLDQKTGKKQWEFETPDQIQCSATVADGKGFVAGCDAFLHLIDLKKGTEVGKVEIHSPTRSTPAVADGIAVFGTEQSSFFAIDLTKVEPIWQFEGEQGAAAVRGSAAIGKGQVIFGARNRKVYSVNASNGKQNWATTLKAKVDASPVIVEDRVLVGSTDGRMYALSLKDGKILWEKEFNGGFLGSPAVAFGRLVVATDAGVVYCLGAPNESR